MGIMTSGKLISPQYRQYDLPGDRPRIELARIGTAKQMSFKWSRACNCPNEMIDFLIMTPVLITLKGCAILINMICNEELL